jgi:uncharacterized protein (DUF1330 family)
MTAFFHSLRRLLPGIAALILAALWPVRASAQVPAAPASTPAVCAVPGYVVALQGIGGSPDPFDAQWTRSIASAGGVLLVDEVPARVYEGPADWGRVTIVRWRCFEDAEAAWKSLPPPASASPGTVLHTAALYRGGNYPTFPESMLRLPAVCVEPAYFMAVNSVIDDAKYDVYRKAMMRTEYVQQLGSTTLFTGAPAAKLANWPADTAASMTRWPCEAAFERFYFDKTYVEQIKPLRAGAIDYRILGFRDADTPRGR